MTAPSFAKVTATTSMTNYERRAARKKAKDARNGIVTLDPGPAPTETRRAGLRGVKLAFSHNEPPRRVVPRAAEATQPKQIPIPRLKEHEHFPPSDSESETDQATAVPLGLQPPQSTEPATVDDDDAQSQAGTIIEDGEEDASGSDDEESGNSAILGNPGAHDASEPITTGNEGSFSRREISNHTAIHTHVGHTTVTGGG